VSIKEARCKSWVAEVQGGKPQAWCGWDMGRRETGMGCAVPIAGQGRAGQGQVRQRGKQAKGLLWYHAWSC